MADSTFWNTFVAAFSLITASELGDKTFFITSIMSVKNSRLAVFVASMFAMTVMNVFSIFIGLLTTNISPVVIHNISIILFFIFGIKMIREGIQMNDDESINEVQEVEKMLSDKQKKNEHNKNDNATKHNIFNEYLSVFVQVFSFIFFAEWGDKSQLSTILLASKEGFAAVALGAFWGYFLCNLIAVLGSRAIAQIISVKKVSIIGGLVFIICSLLKLIGR